MANLLMWVYQIAITAMSDYFIDAQSWPAVTCVLGYHGMGKMLTVLQLIV